MITVYYTKVFSHLADNTFLSYLNKMEEKRRERILRLQNGKEKMRSLTAGCLLHAVLCEKMGIPRADAEPFTLGYLAGGKPYLPGQEGIFFNLSHSGGYVCCALGDVPVGADLQEKTQMKEGIARRFFTGADNLMLSGCTGEEKRDLFFRMWSIKESYVKLTGLGMAKGLSGFEIDFKGKAIHEEGGKGPCAYFEEWGGVEGYGFCVCFGMPGQEVEWKEMDV